MNKNLLAAAVLMVGTLGIVPEAAAQPEFVIPTGAAGCTDCHYDDEGTGYKPGVLDAFKGGLPGLKEFLHPTPVAVGNTKPLLHPIRQQWDVTVGGTPLVIPLYVTDKEDDAFRINLSKPSASPATQGAVFSQERTDLPSSLPVVDFKWSPTAAQANQTYAVNFTAQENSAGHKLLSNSVSATITVWPARNTRSKNIRQIKVHRAQWDKNQLNLAGIVEFKPGLSKAQRAASLRKLQLNMRSNGGIKIGTPYNLVVDANGNWKKSVPLTASTVPCTIKLEYEGLNASSPVKLAPKKSCLQ